MSTTYETFGKYVLLEKLATGGMAEVFLARGTGAGGIGKFFAIKRILPQYADSPEFIEMFKDEAKIAINLSHSNIVSIHEFGVEKGQFFLVMDYVEGRNLRQILNKMKKTGLQFSIDQIVFMIKEVAAGLDHAHRCIDGSTGKPLNITHRDMSPQNVMVSFEGEVKIVDFGIAKAESQLETTRAGTLKGKFGYMSPEQAEGQPVDLRTDIFSLGIVMWELLANDRLFVANNEINTLRKIRDCQIPSLRKINPNIHTELERIVQKALARDRNLRYQTGAALHRDLNRFLNRQYPDFSPQDFAVFIKSVFADEILSLRKRLVEYAKVNLSVDLTIPRPTRQLIDDDPTSLLDTNTNSVIVTETDASSSERESIHSDGPPRDLAALPDDKTELSDSKIDISEVSEHVEFTHQAQTTSTSEKTQPAMSSSQAPTVVAPVIREVEAQAVDESDPHPESTALLDDAALAAGFTTEAAQPTKVHPMNHLPGAPLETEEISGVHRQRRDRPKPKSNYRSDHHRKAVPKPARFATILVFALLCVSVYAYLVKYFTGTMADVIRITDPYLHDFHVAIGVPPLDQVPRSVSSTQPPLADENSIYARLFGSDTHGLVVTSNPSGAEIFLNGHFTGLVTPTRIEVPVQDTFSIAVKKRGYHEYARTEVTRESLGHRIDANLQKLNVGYVDIEIFPPQDAVLYVNGKIVPIHRSLAQEIMIPANTPIKVIAESRNGNTYDEKIVTLASDRRRTIRLNPRKMSRTPASSK